MEMWFELAGIMEEVHLVEEEDQIIWSYCSNGQFSVQSLYAVINHRGVKPIHVQAVWKLKIPPRVQIFLLLLSKNKLLTRDNLEKRRKVEDLTCLFCSETENIHHLFFDCCVAKRMWSVLADIMSLSGNWDYEHVASLWIANKKFVLANVVNAAALWCLCKKHNKLCFQGDVWSGMKELLIWISKTLRGWKPMFSGKMEEKLQGIIQKMEMESNRPPGIGWGTSSIQVLGFQPLAVVYIDVNQQSSELVIQPNTVVTAGL